MQHELECLACLARSAWQSAELATADPASRERAVRRALAALSTIDMATPPPRTGGLINRIVRRECANADPYLPLKRRFNQRALALLPSLRELVVASDDPLVTASRLAVAGNVIDFASGQREGDIRLEATVQECLEAPLDIEPLRARLATAREVLYLLDNAGEAVFDRLLIEQIGPGRVTAVARGGPTLNDVTREDAIEAGIEVPVLDTGLDTPGFDLALVAPGVRERFHQADLVVSKGQGNYETLDGVAHPGLFFLLRAKCGPVARRLGVPLGSVVLARGSGVAWHPRRAGDLTAR